MSREHTETPKQFISIIGGPAVGKSAYLLALTRYLREQTAPDLGMTARFVSPHQERVYESEVKRSKRGEPPDKTDRGLRTAFDLLFQKRGRPVVTLYLYDHAGEAFFDNRELIQHRFIEYLSGILFIVDPFAFPEVRARYSAELSADPYIRPSGGAPDEMLSSLFSAMEEAFGLSPGQRIKTAIAVVINKVDVCGLEQVIGEEALDAAGAPTNTGARNQFRNRLIRQQLLDWGQSHFVQQLEFRFADVSFYTASALGRSPQATRTDGFTPRRVAEPALGLLQRSSTVWTPQGSMPTIVSAASKRLQPHKVMAIGGVVVALMLALLSTAYRLAMESVDTPQLRSEEALGLGKRDWEKVQKWLKAQGSYSDATDGVVGPRTRSAIESLQRAHGIPPTGYLNRAFYSLLEQQARGWAGNQSSEQAMEMSKAQKKKVQDLLRALGHDPGISDGLFGRRTRGAIKGYQTSLGAERTGFMTPDLYRKLFQDAKK